MSNPSKRAMEAAEKIAILYVENLTKEEAADIVSTIQSALDAETVELRAHCSNLQANAEASGTAHREAIERFADKVNFLQKKAKELHEIVCEGNLGSDDEGLYCVLCDNPILDAAQNRLAGVHDNDCPARPDFLSEGT